MVRYLRYRGTYGTVQAGTTVPEVPEVQSLPAARSFARSTSSDDIYHTRWPCPFRACFRAGGIRLTRYYAGGFPLDSEVPLDVRGVGRMRKHGILWCMVAQIVA